MHTAQVSTDSLDEYHLSGRAPNRSVSRHMNVYQLDSSSLASKNATNNGSEAREHSSLFKPPTRSSNTSEVRSISIKVEPDEPISLEDPTLPSSPAILPSSPAVQSAVHSAASSQQRAGGLKTPNQKRRRIIEESKSRFSTLRAKTTMPTGGSISHEELARQGAEAALASRLNPFVLHPQEYQLLRSHICHQHVSSYLNIRNRILRLWTRNPLVPVTPEEAAGCASNSRWLGLAEVAYEWLIRRGYINFGCIEIPDLSLLNFKKHKFKDQRKTIVVIGAGMAGLGCARQLEGLFNHYQEKWTTNEEEPPRVIVLEGRARIGGRIYSHPLRNQTAITIPEHNRCTAEMGAHIITGFDHGNPLNAIIRGQLALSYHPLTDNSSLHDINGKAVDRERDKMVERLFNDILDRASVYRHKLSTPTTVEGDRQMIENGRDPTSDPGKTIAVVEEEAQTILNKPETLGDKGLEKVPAGVDKLTGKAHIAVGTREKAPPAVAAEAMGWKLASNVLAYKDLNLDKIVRKKKYPTLGEAMDEAVKQYQFLLDLGPQDLRLLNWHFANLEYANAANLEELSLGGWDQDIGNEFEGEHAQVIGGYIQVPRGIFESPSRLDLRTRRIVNKIFYDPNHCGETSQPMAKVMCDNGEVFEAHHVVLTVPLGVLKNNSIAFEPALPHWKTSSIRRLGFGILNKVVLVYEKPFWDVEQDMIGLLRDTNPAQSRVQDDYSSSRGRFYLFWNCIKTSGRPVLIALMAGESAQQAEQRSDAEIVAEVSQQLMNMFKPQHVPKPSETVVTRWGQDKFARGTYSFVAPQAHSNDYDSMAKRVGNLHFAGEATCGTHPATVHGAYISGLRVASEIIDDFLGSIPVADPLVPIPIKLSDQSPKKAKTQSSVSQESTTAEESPAAKQARLEAFEAEILKCILEKIGLRPDKPTKVGANPFLLFSKDKWTECRERCDAAKQGLANGSGVAAKATRNEIRAALGKMWREAGPEVKEPYIERTKNNRVANQSNAQGFHEKLAQWDAEAMTLRREYIEAHPGVLSRDEEREMWQALGVFAGGSRKAKRLSGYADESGEEL